VARYAARRFLLAVPALLGLSFLVFVLATVAPGDPAEVLAAKTAVSGQATEEEIALAQRELKLDRPFLVQYGSWLGGAVRGDLGMSFSLNKPVTGELRQAFPATLQLAATAFLLSLLLAFPLGIIAALFHRRFLDHLLRGSSLVGASIPGFFLAYVLVFAFAVRFHLLPVAGNEGATSIILPALVVAIGPAAVVSRLLRASLLEVMGDGYIATARGKGLREIAVVVDHAVRNAAVPVVTVLGGVVAGLLEGSVIAETIFAWPGLGRLTLRALEQQDYPMVLGAVTYAAVVFVLMNLLVDLSYSVVNPRVRVGERR